MKITKTRLKQIIKEEFDRVNEGFFDNQLTKTPDASEKFPRHENIYDAWVSIGNEIKTVNGRFFEIIGDDWDFVLDLLSTAHMASGKIWEKDTEDSGYAHDFGFPNLTGSQQDTIGTIGRVGLDMHRLIRTTPAGHESYNAGAEWKMLTDYKLFDHIAQWVRELEKPDGRD